LRTSGIGLNLSSYLDYIGSPPRIGFDVPATYTFNSLYGDVFGTHIDVTCTDAQHTLTTDSVWNCGGDFPRRYYEIDTQKGVHLALSSELDVLAIGSALIYQRGVPILTIAVPFDVYEAAVYECTYSGNDFVASVSVDSRVSSHPRTEKFRGRQRDAQEKPGKDLQPDGRSADQSFAAGH
jgi:hypothetical protein